MIDGASLLAAPFFAFIASGLWQERRGANLLDSGAPFYDTYETADGRWMAVACLEPRFFAEFARLLPLAGDLAARQYDRSAWPAMRTAIAAAHRPGDPGRVECPVRADGRLRRARARPRRGTAAPAQPGPPGACGGVGGLRRPAPAPRLSRTPLRTRRTARARGALSRRSAASASPAARPSACRRLSAITRMSRKGPETHGRRRRPCCARPTPRPSGSPAHCFAPRAMARSPCSTRQPARRWPAASASPPIRTAHLLSWCRCSPPTPARCLPTPAARCCFGEPGKGDPLAHPRITLACRAAKLRARHDAGHARAARRFLNRNPKATLYAGLRRFLLSSGWSREGASLNGGFGKAYLLGRGRALAAVPASRPRRRGAGRHRSHERRPCSTRSPVYAQAFAKAAGDGGS